MAYLYKNSQGYEVHKHSYSAGSDFRKCKRFYELKRVVGWQEKEDRATARFGNALEAGIRFYHENESKPGRVSQEFTRLWEAVKETPVSYKDSSWEEMLQQGQEMGRLYEVLLPTLPIRNPRFQLYYKKEPFPGTNLGGIDFVAYVDMLSEYEDGKFLVIDIKTSGKGLYTDMLTLDPQLRAYSWISGVPDVAFLWFTRMSLEPRKGDLVTILKSMSGINAGSQLYFFAKGSDGNPDTLLEKGSYEAYSTESKGLKGKALDAVKSTYEKKAIVAYPSEFTKQRLDFKRDHITEDQRRAEGNRIGRDIAEIVDCRDRKDFPEEVGIRFPDDKCLMCSMRGICGNRPKLVEELLVKPDGQKDKEKDWLDDLED